VGKIALEIFFERDKIKPLGIIRHQSDDFPQGAAASFSTKHKEVLD
jgi:hypothetical protein